MDAKAKPADRPARVDRREGLTLLKRLWRDQVVHHWRWLVAILVAVGFIAATTSSYPLLITYAFDWFSEKNALAITTLPWLVAAATVLKGLGLYAQVTLTARVATRVTTDMKVALYRHLVDADIARLSRESPANLSQRFLTDVRYVQGMLSRAATTLVRDGLTMVGLVCAMLWLDWQLTLVAFLILPFAVFPVVSIGRRLRQVARTSQEQSGILASLTSETFGAARVVKAFGMEDYLEGRARTAFEALRRVQMKSVLHRGRMEPILEALAGLTIAVVLLIVGWRILEGEATIGEFSGFLAALLVASQPIRSLSNLNATVQEGLSALKRYYQVLDEPPLVTERPGARAVPVERGEVRFEDVSFAYADGSPALHGVSFTAGAGEVTAFVGRSGAGKSTVFNLVPRLYDVTGGRVLVDGVDVRDITLASLRAAIAVVNQDVMLFNDTVAANIGFGRMGATRGEVEEAARLAAADGFIARLPEGYDTLVGDRGTRLSGGERQRIALARAFLKDAPILLLDEATSALDAESEAAIQDALARLARGRTTLVIAHRLATIRSADRIVVLDAGRVAESGVHGSLVDADGLYARFHALQFGDPDGAAAPEALPAAAR